MNASLERLTTLLRIRSRALEAWLGAAIAAAGVCGLVAPWSAGDAGDAGDAPRLAAAILAGGLAQAAAGLVGMLPTADRRGPIVWLVQIGWPVGGACLAAVFGRGVVGGTAWEPAAVGVGIAAAATALLGAACAGKGCGPADAVSIALVSAAAAAAAAVCAAGGGRAVPAAGAAWTLAAAAGLSICRPDPWAAVGGAGQAAGPVASPFLPGQGPVAATLATFAMLTSLAGMVFWFFLDPARGAWYPLLATTWFICLAVPQALGLSAAGRPGILARSAAGADSAWWSPAARRGRGIALAYAVVLGWPAIVALALYGGGAFSRAEFARWPAVTVAVLAVAAGLLTALVPLAVSCGLRRQGGQALAFAMVAVLGGAAACSLPGLPFFAGLPQAALLVERDAAFGSPPEAAKQPANPRRGGSRGLLPETVVEKLSGLER